MNSIEERLVQTLKQEADAVVVTFTADDVVAATLGSDSPIVQGRRHWVLVAAALALISVVSWGLLADGDRSATVATAVPSPGTDGAQTPTTAPIAPEGRPVELERLTEAPRFLGPTAVVLEAAGVGRVEVGPSPVDGDNQQWLDDARCVATEVLVACIGDALPDGSPEVFVSADDDFYGGLRGQPRDTHDSPFAAYTEPSPIGIVLISDLAPEVAVVALVTDEPLTQEPIAGTAVFPFQSDPTDGTVKFLGFDSSGVLNMVFELEIAPPPDISSLDTAGTTVAIGRIEIDAIDLSWDLYNTVDPKALRFGPGRYPGTARAGEAGNIAIAGHRVAWGAPFNRLDELAVGDEIRVSVDQQSFVYVVIAQPDGQAFAVVVPSETSVIADSGSAMLTLTTKHPEFSARQRLIVQAELIGEPTGPSSAKPDAAEQIDELS